MEPIAEAKEAPNNAGRSAFTAADVEAIVYRRGWLPAPPTKNGGATAEQEVTEARRQWMAEAAQLLGPQANDLPAFERLLERIFSYEAAQLLARAENQAALSREGARDVLRELAARVLETPAVDSDRFKEIVAALKETTGRRGPELFHPVRLALAGCAGEGEYDRVILLLDGAARLPWAMAVKGCRQRILEFCGALD
jgi:glutamyl/glutaminyl-tRNA synthetase